MRKSILSLFVCAFTSVFVACNSPKKVVETNITAIKEAKLANSLLWKISGNGLEKPSYLYGTIHITCNYKPSEKLIMALDQTDQITLEIDMDDPGMQAKMMQNIMMKDGQTMKKILSDVDYKKVESFFMDTTGMNIGLFDAMKPIAVTSMLVTKMVPCAAPASYEAEFVKIAKAQNEEVKGLETVEYQMAVFDSIPYADQFGDLVKMADGGQEESKIEFEKLNALYENEDIEGLVNMLKDEDNTLGKFSEKLLDTRNKNWIPVIEKMSKEKSTFYGVGSMHLAGENGVIKLLRKRGYLVEAVN